MQLIIIVLAAFILGYWFSRTKAAARLTDNAQHLASRLRRKPNTNPEKVANESGKSTGK